MTFIFKSLLRMKGTLLLILIQLAFSLSLLSNIIYLGDYSQNKKEKFEELFNINTTYLMRVQNQLYNPNSNFDEYPLLNDVMDELYKLNGDKDIRNIYLYGFPFSFDHKLLQDESVLAEGSGNVILVDENFTSRKVIEITDGRTLKNTDFQLNYKNDVIPILVGNGFKGKISIGDIYESEEVVSKQNDYTIELGKVKYQVVGFVKENELITFKSKSNLSQGATFNNNIIVAPVVKNCYSLTPSTTFGDFGVNLELSPGGDIKRVEEKINTILDGFNNKYKIGLGIKSNISLKQDLGAVSSVLDRDSTITKVLVVILISISIIGITAIFLGELKRRKREFGIKIANGATRATLCKELILEITLICVFSIILSFIINIYMNKSIYISPLVFGVNIVYIIVLTFSIALFPVIRLRKMNVIEMVRGK